LHRANASLLLVIGLLAEVLSCASGGTGAHAALGWSLGGEAHVFIADDRFARDLYHQLTGHDLEVALLEAPLVAVDAREPRSVTVLSTSGAAPARLTLARFHTGESCGAGDFVSELVFAFPPSGGGGHSTPPSHVPVVALLDEQPFAGGAGAPTRALLPREARALVNGVAQRAESTTHRQRGTLVRPLIVDADQSADAGEVVSIHGGYAVGFRARYTTAASDTFLLTGVATTDLSLRDLHWVARPQRLPLRHGMTSQGVRYSVRGWVAGSSGGTLLLIDQIADVSVRDSRATVLDPTTRAVVASQPLALRCP